MFRGALTHFEVDARALGAAGGAAVTARIRSPSGGGVEAAVEDRGDGTYGVQYTPYEEGMGAMGCSAGPMGCSTHPMRKVWVLWGAVHTL